MIDLHSHILPSIDDGARNIDDALAMLYESESQGVTHVLATPHIHIGTFDNDLRIIQTAFEQVQQAIDLEKLQIKLAYAAEVRICPEILQLALSEQLPFVGTYQGKNVLLLEFPHSHVPPGSEKLVDWLLARNILPLIAHPERNRDAWSLPEIMSPFIRRNCLFQITAGSLLGDFGERASNLAWRYLESNSTVVVASDMHNLSKRAPKMRKAFELVHAALGDEKANYMFNDLPLEILMSNVCFKKSSFA